MDTDKTIPGSPYLGPSRPDSSQRFKAYTARVELPIFLNCFSEHNNQLIENLQIHIGYSLCAFQSAYCDGVLKVATDSR